MSLAAIRRALLEAKARRLSGEHPVWELAGPWWPFSRRARRHGAIRLEILEATVGLSGPTYLVSEENPQEYDVGGPWAHAQASTWAVPEVCDLLALSDRVLVLGDWTLYCRPEPLEPDRFPDMFRAPPREIAEFAVAHGVSVIIEAFHDNDPWRLWVEDVRTRREAAA